MKIPKKLSYAASAFFWMSCLGCSSKTVPEKAPAVPVTLQTAQPSQPETGTHYSAALIPDRQLNLSFESPSFVVSILRIKDQTGNLREIQGGDPVTEGMVLATVRRTEYLDQVSSARANFMQAKADYVRSSALYEQNVLSKSDYDAALSKFQTAQAALRKAELALRDTVLKAPMDGTLIKRDIEVGTLVTAQTEAFVIENTKFMKAVFGVPDVAVSLFKMGEPIQVVLDAYPEKSITARVSKIAASADSSTRMFDVEVSMPNAEGKLKDGMIASITPGSALALSKQMAGTAGSVEVPLSSVVRPKDDPTGYCVYVAKKNGTLYEAEERRVTLGELLGNRIKILSGLSPNDPVVVMGATLLSNYQEIKIIPNAQSFDTPNFDLKEE